MQRPYKKKADPFAKDTGHRVRLGPVGEASLRGGENALEGFSEGRKGCGNLMEIPTEGLLSWPTELAFLKFKGKCFLPLMGSHSQRGTEASRKVRAPN